MHQTALEPLFLHVYNVDSERWQSTILGSPVSPHSQEAMNLILRKDGILAFIGTRLEFGHYKTELAQESGKDSPCCWTSCPAYTIMSVLGLCLNTENPGKPEMAFFGSPLTRVLAYMLTTELNRDILISEVGRIGHFDLGDPESEPWKRVYAHELLEALTYLND